MLERIRVRLARLLTVGTECTVVRNESVEGMRQAALELSNYVDRSGALNDEGRVHAWRRIYALTSEIQAKAINSEVEA